MPTVISNTSRFSSPSARSFSNTSLSKLVHSLVTVKKPVVGLISGLQINGGFDMMSSSPTPAWAVIEQLQQGFEVRNIAPQADKIDPDITTLMIVHPTGLSDALQYAIDQFVLKGGKAIVYVDPYCESAKASANPLLEQGSAPTSSNLEKLFKAWGVQYSPDKVVGDAGTALQISFAADQPPVKASRFPRPRCCQPVA